jgi:thymidylate synthase (FAD)
MKIIDASYEILTFLPEQDVHDIALGYCLCYGRELPETYEDRCAYIKAHRRHESPLEHSRLTVLFNINRGISHELVRHRHTGFSQQSTRYCNYSQGRFGSELTFINDTSFIDNADAYNRWVLSRKVNEAEYFMQLDSGLKPEQARGGLPNDLATKLLVTTNYREWRSIFKLRCSSHAHYQMREVMQPLFDEVCTKLPCVFDDISF